MVKIQGENKIVISKDKKRLCSWGAHAMNQLGEQI